jgi:hypothetical protein
MRKNFPELTKRYCLLLCVYSIIARVNFNGVLCTRFGNEPKPIRDRVELPKLVEIELVITGEILEQRPFARSRQIPFYFRQMRIRE